MTSSTVRSAASVTGLSKSFGDKVVFDGMAVGPRPIQPGR
jgi:hypothetical protein